MFEYKRLVLLVCGLFTLPGHGIVTLIIIIIDVDI